MSVIVGRPDVLPARAAPVRPELAKLLAEGPFAEALRAAIKGSGLSLDRIQHRLQLRGVTISVATLSYWQSGRRRPERPESLDALRHLEAVLRVPAHALTALLGPPRPRGRRRRADALLPIDELWGEEVKLAQLLDRVDTSCDNQLSRISQHDRCVVGSDRRPRSIQVSQVLRAEQDGVDRWIMVYDWDESTPQPAQLFPLRNCRTGRVAVALDEHIMVAELLFDRPLARGETLIMEHKVVNPPELQHAEDLYYRRFRLPVRDYLLEIQFDREALPTRCHQFSSPEYDLRVGKRRNLTVSPSGEVHTVGLSVGPGLFGIEWEW